MTLDKSADAPTREGVLDSCGLLVQMTALGAVLVIALVLLASAPFALALSVLCVLLVAGTVAAAWCTLRFLAFEEEGDPACLPSPRRRSTQVVAEPPRAADAGGRSATAAKPRRSVVA